VAIKFCGKMGMFYSCLEAFRFEVSVMSLLDHPNVMFCYGANETDPEPFIVMPMRGKLNLQKRILIFF
jgi:hypothetical protein